MQGKVVHFKDGEGLIISDNGERYKFTLSEWKDEGQPAKGDIVDFVPDESFAKEIIVLEKRGTSPAAVNPEEMQSAKVLGGIGSIFLFLAWVPFLGIILGIVGFIMISIAIKKISDTAPEKGIFKKWIIALITAIVSVIVGILIGGGMSAVADSIQDEDTALAAIGIGTILFLILAWSIQIVLGVLYKQIFSMIAEVTNENLFKTAGSLFFWGGILYIILIGGILSFIAWILVTIAFFSINTSTRTN